MCRQMAAAEALGNIKSDTAVQPLINALEDEDKDVRMKLRPWALNRNIKSDTAVQPLINALKDKDSIVRRRAARALGNIKSDTAVQPLINALKDEDSICAEECGRGTWKYQIGYSRAAANKRTER